MASDLFRDTLKDKNQLEMSNPRTRSIGGLTSSDYQYKNFLAGMKPRSKSNSFGSNSDSSSKQSSSFVDSAIRTAGPKSMSGRDGSNSNNIEKDQEEEKNKAHKALYAEFSQVPSKKDSSFINNNNQNSAKQCTDSSSTKVQTESFGSVGKLRSLFDNGEGQPVQLRVRNINKGAERPMSTGFNFEKKGTVSGIYNRENFKEQRKSLDLDLLLSSSTKENIAESNTTSNNSSFSKPKLRHTSSSEFDENFEDRIIPTGVKKIDVNSILAPEDPVIKKEKDTNDANDVTGRSLNDDLQKQLEIDRLKRTQDEVAIEKRFNVKRRSLKERLNLLASETEDDPYNKPGFRTSDTYASVDKYDEEDTTEEESQFLLQNGINSSINNEQPVTAVESLEVQGNSPDETIEDVSISSSIDQKPYKSAVERFDEFITQEKIVPTNASPDIKPSTILSMDANQNIIELENGNFLNDTSDTDVNMKNGDVSQEHLDDSNLMDSILQHMESTNASNDLGKDCIRHLRSESATEVDPDSPVTMETPPLLPKTETPVTTPSDYDGEPDYENRPAVLPRRSKQLALTHTSAITPPVSEEETTSPTVERATKPRYMPPLAVTPPVSEEEEFSRTTEEATKPRYKLPTPSTSECDSESTDECSSDEFQLPSPPTKSNLVKSREGPRKVIFKVKDLEQVIHTYGPSEYDRANADIDPIASSAEWELEKRVDNMDIFSVDLHKDERGLGLSIIGLGVGTESGVEKLGIFVKTLTENGASQKDGRIQVNDQILEVNGVSLVGVTQYFAAQTLKGTNGVVRFLMGREKSRRPHFAPGAPMAENPGMQKHIEEMNKILSQMEDLEQRAINAENTLDDVKIELLKAEERAHDAEHHLGETKEQLKAVTESPFISGQRKMKNEIKKKGNKGEKVDELQRNLKDMTNRLSLSEENLLQLNSVNDEKHRELEELKLKVEETHAHQKQLEESNNKLNVDINEKNDLLSKLQQDNDTILKQLENQKKLHQEEKDAITKQQAERLEKATGSERDLKTKITELEVEISSLASQLKHADEMSRDAEELKKTQSNVPELKKQLEHYQKTVTSLQSINVTQKDEIVKLNEKNEYLQTLIVKLDDSLQDYNTEKYRKENHELKQKIQELESEKSGSKPKFFKDITTEEEITIQSEIQVESLPRFDLDGPFVPKRHQDQINVDSSHPPEILREKKPNPQILTDADTESEIPIAVTVNNVEHENPISLDLLDSRIDDDQLDLPDAGNLKDFANPVPKPPRGLYVETDDDFVIVENPELSEVSSKDEYVNVGSGVKEDLKEKPDLSIDLSACQPTIKPLEEANIEQEVLLENSSLVQGVSDSIILSAVTEASTPDHEYKNLTSKEETEILIQDSVIKEPPKKDMHIKYLQESSPSAVIGSPEDHLDISTDGDDDQGQFQLISIDVQEEQSTPNTSIAGRPNSAKKDASTRSSFFESLNQEPNISSWLDDEWKRLNSSEIDEQAEKIAAQVTAASPSRRKESVISSSSEDEQDEHEDEHLIDDDDNRQESWNRNHSIKMDASYFRQSAPIESFDQELSILDDDTDKTDGDPSVIKSTSFSTVIPPTPVLDNKVQLDKRQLVKSNEKRKPTRRARDQLDSDKDEFQTNTLPRQKNPSASTPNLITTTAVSTPNLLHASTSASSIEKPEKTKHKFGFHLPKVFKKGKLSKKASFDSSKPSSPTASEKNASLQEASAPTNVYTVEVLTTPVEATAADVNLTADDKFLPNSDGTEMVPIDQKEEAVHQQNVNDAATEEAVVPFADKEELMDEVVAETPQESSNAEISPDDDSVFLTTIDVHSSADEKIVTSPDEIELDLSSSVSARDNNVSPQVQNSAATDVSPSEQYNERGIDVGNIENGHVEEEQITHWTRRAPNDWDVRQVGLWLVETNFSMYVNSFKSHNVDGQALLRADGNKLKDYGVNNTEDRAEIKKRIKEFRQKLGKDSYNKSKTKDHKSTKDKLQFWKGKYKVPH